MGKRKSHSWMPRELERTIKRFRVLDDWKIKYDPESIFKAQANINLEKKIAVIFAWPDNSRRPKEYFLHEVLHIAIRAIIRDWTLNTGKRAEEIVIQDICAIFTKQLKNAKKN